MTSPSSGASGPLQRRLDVAVDTVRHRGYEVTIGRCMDGEGHMSAPALERAAEFEAMLLDPGIRAIVPPWGGDTAIDLIPLLHWEAIAAAEPTWVVGYSDMSTLITPLTLVSGIATIHGNNLMDTPYRVPDGLHGWLDIVAQEVGTTFTQVPPRHHRRAFVDYETHPSDSDLVSTSRRGGAGWTTKEVTWTSPGGSSAGASRRWRTSRAPASPTPPAWLPSATASSCTSRQRGTMP